MAMGKQKLPQTLISIGSLFLMVANMALSQTTHFVVPPFNNLIFQGDAFVPNDTSFIRLTKTVAYSKPQLGSAGRVMYSKPFTFWGDGKQVEFETKITFKITPTDYDPADAIAFFIAPMGSIIPQDSTSGSVGVLAVEFDTYINEWDPAYRHIGIDVNSPMSVETARLDDSVLGEVATLSIKYKLAENTITVKAQVGSYEHYDLSYELDLSTILQSEVQVGLSASTGSDVALHDIYSWEPT